VIALNRLILYAASSLALAAACSSATCPSGRIGGTGACITENANRSDDTDSGNTDDPGKPNTTDHTDDAADGG
jgi:hypothetical protein